MSGPDDSDATNGVGRHDVPPRSVAAEAALLLDLLSQRGSFAGPFDGSGSRSDSGTEPKRNSGSTGRTDGGGCTCGGAAPAACRICPVCQVIAFVQKINPDTIERIADFATFAATALRDVASAQRTASSPKAEAPDAAEPDLDDPAPPTGGRP